ncbi:MAG: divalent-cation tolerance protein CutA [Pseudomonadota bacterium]
MTLVVVTSTVSSEDEAKRLAHALVKERLAACVQITSIRSIYQWQGAVEEAEEFRLDCKTPAARKDALMAKIAALHSYDEPEILCVPADASPGYTAWAEAATGAEKTPDA